MLDITLKQLEAFTAAAEYNSFTRAAEELYLTQSTVSACSTSSMEPLISPRDMARIASHST